MNLQKVIELLERKREEMIRQQNRRGENSKLEAIQHMIELLNQNPEMEEMQIKQLLQANGIKWEEDELGR